MQFNVFDTVKVVLQDAKGNELQCMAERDKTFIPEPLILEPRESQTVYRNAILEWSEDRKSLRLSGSDGTGGHWHFDGLKPGKYTVHFVVENNDDLLKSVLDRLAKHVIDPKEAPFWMGKATTKEMAVELVETPEKAK